MATAREARRALARGDVDLALVLLWNAVEPHRLEGDRAGLEAIGRMAASIAERGDPSQAPEAARLVEEVREVLAYESGREAEPVAHVSAGFERAEELVVAVEPPASTAQVEPVETFETVETLEGPPGAERPERPERSKLTGLIWAILVAIFILLNVVNRLVGE